MIRAAAAFLFLLLGVVSLWADDYPSHNVTFIVPTGAGAATDLLARTLAPQLSERLGKPFVVEDRPGAGTMTGSNTVAKSTPDGYTILMGTSTPLAILATLYKHLPYDPAKDFVPLALIATIPFVLVVNNDLPVHSVRELIDYAKAHPGELSYGSTGPGSPFHLNGGRPDGACALQGGGRRAGRSDRRAHPGDVHRFHFVGAADQGWKNASPRRHHKDPRRSDA
jgi:tripartite-type tricarboxylate transporter receptor subunit TctC